MKRRLSLIVLSTLVIQVGMSQNSTNLSKECDSLSRVLNVEEVVVTGTRSVKRLSESPVLTTVIRASDIAKSGSVTLNQVLEDNIPGMLVYDAGAMGTDIYMKGLTTQYILILVDGERLVSDGRNGNVNLDQIDASTVQRVEYINGAASSLYGSNAMGGVINIITKEPQKRISAGAEYLYEDTGKNKYRVNVSSKLDKFSVAANGSYGAQDYYLPDEGDSISEYDEASGDLKVQYRPHDRLRMSGTGRYYQIETFNSPTSVAVYHYLDYAITGGGAISYISRDYRNVLDGSFSYNTSRQYYVMEQYNNYKQPNDFNGYLSAKLIDSYKWDDQLDLMLGAEYNNETASSADKLGDGVANKSNYDFNLFAQADWDITKDFNAIFGVRYTQNEMFGASFDPKVSLMYKYNKFTFRGGVGTAYKAPSLKELYYEFQHSGGGSAVFYISGNPDLEAEKGFFTSLSTEYTAKDLNISASLYYNNIRNKINMVEIYDADDDDDGFADQTYENVDRAIIKGVDVSARYTLLKQFVLSGNYTLNFSDDENGDPISGTSRHYSTLSATWNGNIKNEPFSLQFSGRISSPRYSYDSDYELVSTDSFSIWKATFVKPITMVILLLSQETTQRNWNKSIII